MPRPKSTPSYCHHRQSDNAYVTIDGRQIMLGRFDSPESRAKYDRIIAEWLLNGRKAPEPAAPAPAGPTVSMIAQRFLEHARTHYRKPDGRATRELANFVTVIRGLVHFHGETRAEQFGPNALRAWRDTLTKPIAYTHRVTGKPVNHSKGWSRTNANKQVRRVVQIFKWAVSREMVPPSVHQALATIEPLQFGRTDARESEPVKPVAEEHVQAIAGAIPKRVRAILELQLLTGARGGELCLMRGCDLETGGGAVWIYRPSDHKTRWRGQSREIPLGKRCQDIINPYLKLDPQAYLFSPADEEAERRAKLSEARKTPPGYGNGPGTNKSESPARPPGDRYTPDSYRRAVQRACETMFPPPAELARQRVMSATRKRTTRQETRAEWRKRMGPEKWAEVRAWTRAHRFHPHQVRHTVATKLRKLFGLEAAGVVLGQKHLAATLIYAEQDRELAQKVMKEIG